MALAIFVKAPHSLQCIPSSPRQPPMPSPNTLCKKALVTSAGPHIESLERPQVRPSQPRPPQQHPLHLCRHATRAGKPSGLRREGERTRDMFNIVFTINQL